MDKSIVRADDIVWRKIGDEVVVIKDNGLSVHLLNKTAALIWEMCADTCEPEKIAAGLCERFEISFDEARTDAEEILAKLELTGLLKEAEGLPRQ